MVNNEIIEWEIINWQLKTATFYLEEYLKTGEWSFAEKAIRITMKSNRYYERKLY